MKKRKWYPLCYAACALAAAGFGVKVARDWHIYTTTLNSAPVYLWIIVDGIYFLIPSLLCLMLGRWLQKKPR